MNLVIYLFLSINITSSDRNNSVHKTSGYQINSLTRNLSFEIKNMFENFIKKELRLRQTKV